MFHRIVLWLLLFWACASVAQARVKGPLPKSDLVVEIRQIEESQADAGSYRVGTVDTARDWPPVSLVVRNGKKGVLRLQQAVPMQWVQSAQSQSSSLAVSGATASSAGGGVTQSLLWFDVGQSVAVTAKWPGGKQEVSLELDVVQSDMQPLHNADLPRQVRNQTRTLVVVPLNQWITLAASGKGPGPTGSYSSEARADVRRLLQVRVSVP